MKFGIHAAIIQNAKKMNEMSNNTKIKPLSLELKRQRALTCIIGGKCSDGVVSDKKITDYKSYRIQDKLIVDFYPVVVGSSGSLILYEKFRPRAQELANKLLDSNGRHMNNDITADLVRTSGAFQPYNFGNVVDAINTTKYSDGLEDIVRDINNYYSSSVGETFDLLIGIQEQVSGSKLQYISPKGVAEDISNYKTIGGGQDYAEMILKPLLHTNIKMIEMAEIAYFVIRYIDQFKFDTSIGVEDQNPQFWFIPNIGQLYDDKQRHDIVTSFDGRICKMLNNLKQNGISALLPNDPEG